MKRMEKTQESLGTTQAFQVSISKCINNSMMPMKKQLPIRKCSIERSHQLSEILL